MCTVVRRLAPTGVFQGSRTGCRVGYGPPATCWDCIGAAWLSPGPQHRLHTRKKHKLCQLAEFFILTFVSRGYRAHEARAGATLPATEGDRRRATGGAERDRAGREAGATPVAGASNVAPFQTWRGDLALSSVQREACKEVCRSRRMSLGAFLCRVLPRMAKISQRIALPQVITPPQSGGLDGCEQP